LFFNNFLTFFFYFEILRAMKRAVSEIIQGLEAHAPSGTAESWDNVGLLVGDPRTQTTGAVVCVDLTEEALREAKKRGYGLIVNHHPCIFPRSKGIGRIVGGDTGKSGLIYEAIRSGISIAAYHTNFDRCALEVVHGISKELGVVPKGRLLDHPSGALIKLVVFVPRTHAETVRQALGAAGAGHLGDYDFCSFSTEGTGRFRGADTTRPFIGKPGKLEEALEVRLETVFPRGLEKPVLQALRGAHPYEEIAYDLYPLEQTPSALGLVKGLGYGFWGEFPKPKPFSVFVKDVKKAFKVTGFLLSDPAPNRLNAKKMIRKIGFAAGKGASVLGAAAAAGCDVFVTGEAGYHDAIAVSEYRKSRPMAVMELGHRESERFFVLTASKWLEAMGLRTVKLHTSTQKIWAL
jgi:dinuclear metal center YbgI/SA1388 family protein